MSKRKLSGARGLPIAAVLLMGVAALAILPPTASGEIYQDTLRTFSDGASIKSFNLSAPCDWFEFNVTLPFDARIYGSSLNLRDGQQAKAATGTIAIDFGADGTDEDTQDISRLYDFAPGVMWTPLNTNMLTTYIASLSGTGNVNVPIRVTPCLSFSPWNITADFEITYKAGAPTFTVPIPDFQVVLGSSDGRWPSDPMIRNLTEHFPGTFNPVGKPPLPYLWHWSVERDDAASGSASAVIIDNARPGPFSEGVLEPRNDTMEFLEITSTGTWTGPLVFRITVTDFWNRSAISNDITLCVVASPGAACGPASDPGPVVTAPVAIRPSGIDTSTVEAGVPTYFEVALNRPLSQNGTILWLVDGRPAGSGSRLANVSLAEGNHDVEVRVNDDGQTQTLHRLVFARPPGALGAVPLLAGFNELQRVLILLGLAITGVFFARSGGGRFLVASFIAGALLPRARKEALLDHFVRGRIYQVISENPGIHFSELRRRVGVGNGTALHHISILEKAGFVRVVIEMSKTRFFATDQPFDREEYGLTPLDQQIVDAVARQPGIQQRELSRSLGKSPGAVSRAVQRLSGFGYLSTTRTGRNVAVFPREAQPRSAAPRVGEYTD